MLDDVRILCAQVYSSLETVYGTRYGSVQPAEGHAAMLRAATILFDEAEVRRIFYYKNTGKYNLRL